MTPLEFIQNYLVGTGIAVLPGATFNGSTLPLNSALRPALTLDQIGSFTTTGGAALALGLDGGVILSSGKVQDATAGSLVSTQTGGGSDPDLFILSNVEIFDKSVLEFNFIPETDFLQFRYVFSSAEFDTYCEGSYNDAFGLFLSGPGISGGQGFQNDAENIAILPDESSFVNIHNICIADNGNTGNGKYSWWNLPPGIFFSHHRFTYVYTASYSVECGQTYHMKFAIGDAGDNSWDSDVFLEQNSFSSNNFTPNIDFTNPGTGDLLIPGCSNINLSYQIPQPKNTDLIINLVIDPSGTATQSDILPNPFPTQVVIPAHQVQSAIIPIEAIPLATPGPDKTLVIKASVTTCAILHTVTNPFTIKYNDVLTANAPPAVSCSGTASTLTAMVAGGQPFLPASAYHYIWSTGATSSAISVNPPPGHNVYTVSVTDACSQTISVPTWVDVGTTPGNAGDISGPSTLCTPANGKIFSVPQIPGADDYFWTLPPGATIVSGLNTRTITVNFNTSASSGNISVKGHSTYCGEGNESTLLLTINPSPEPAGTITGPEMVCQGPSAITYKIEPLAYTGIYDWSVPPGVTVISGSGTNEITCLFTSNAVSGDFTVRGYNADCGYGLPSSLTVTIKPIPADAGTIVSANGSEVCQNQSGVLYTIAPVPNASGYLWSYSGTGITSITNGPNMIIDFSATATSGILTVKAHNDCGDGLQSPPFSILVKPKPAVSFSVCNSIVTTKNGRPISLKGGFPAGTGGVYSGTGVSLAGPGKYIFDPGNPVVVGGGPNNAIDYQVTYRFTNSQGCFDDNSITISVYGSNANDPCTGTMRDHRDGTSYPVFFAGAGVNARCWMAANLNYGMFTDQNLTQTDNCTIQKYCTGNLEANCTSSGGHYQWGEIMEYEESGMFQDICPAGWHIPSSLEWNGLIDAVSNRNFGDGIAGDFLLYTTGFHALTNGLYYMNNTWAFNSDFPTATMFWTSTPAGIKSVSRGLNMMNPSVSYYESAKVNAFPVRCIKN